MAELDPNLYTVAWIAPLEIEARAALHMLDNRHQGRFPLSRGDDYVFLAGDMCRHNIIIATLPGGQPYGTGSAAALASQVKRFFPNLWFGLLVGVAAGLPNLSRSPPIDIRLGDVLVGLSIGDSASIISYDLGKETGHDGFQPLHFGHVLANTKTVVRSAINSIRLGEPDNTDAFLPFYASIKHKNHTNGTFVDPGQDQDRLYECNNDGIEYVVQREPRPDSKRTRVWYGPIGSGEKLMKNAQKRNELRDKYNVIGLEMEAAGTMNQIPVGVIRGVCDYGDKHKNKEWQPYAAAMAAAYAKAVLTEIHPKYSRKEPAATQYVFTEEDNRCLSALLLTNPSTEKARIKQTKGGLLDESFRWILDNPEFQKWRYDQDSRLLWIKGDAGYGKTMLIIGIIEELSLPEDNQQPRSAKILSYFLCQGTDSRLNNAIAVLRGMVYHLINQQPFLILHLRKQYDHAGQKLFEGPSAFHGLSEVFQQMLQDPRLLMVYLAVDALDECETGLPELLDLIIRTSCGPSQVKWIVSSRNRDDIDQILRPDEYYNRLSLELNSDHISHAVDAFIVHKISKLKLLQHNNVLRKQVQEQLRDKSDSTFLWVALVFEELQKSQLHRDVTRILKRIPKGIIPLYKRMILQIQQLEDDYPQLCLLLVSVAILVFRPVHLLEIRTLAGLEEEISELEDLERIINMCGSLLIIRDNYIYLIHQSAKDYLTTEASASIFPAGPRQIHHKMFLQSLSALPKTLRQNIYNLKDFGPIIGDIVADPDPLAPIRYSCLFWFDHLCACDNQALEYSQEFTDSGRVFAFLKKHLLHWIESLSLIHEISRGILIIKSLLQNVQAATSIQFTRLLQDAKRCLLSNRAIIEQAPLQIYGTALTFSPQISEIRVQHWQNRLPCIKNIIGIRNSWDLCLQTLEGHTGPVHAVTFSPDGQTLASASGDYTVRLWETATGIEKQTLNGHTDFVQAVTFSPDGQTVASASGDHTVRLWETATGIEKQTLKGHTGFVQVVIFSPDGQIVASASGDHTVRLWETATGIKKQTLKGHTDSVQAVTFSPDGQTLASASEDYTVRLWEITTGIEKQMLKGHTGPVQVVAFSPDGWTLASASGDHTVRLWETATGIEKRTLKGHTDAVQAVTFSPDGQTLASASWDHTVRLWETATGIEKQMLEGHTDRVQVVTFSPDSQTLASASLDYTVRLWETATGIEKQTLKGHTDFVQTVTFSPDGQTLASASLDQTIRLWEAATGIEKQMLKGHTDRVQVVAFSPDGQTLASASLDYTVRLWETATGIEKQILKGHTYPVQAVTFSPDGQTLASASEDYTVRLWETATGIKKQTLKGHTGFVQAVTFSPDGRTLASASRDQTVRLWETATGIKKQTLKGHTGPIQVVVFSPDSQTLASPSNNHTVRLWETATGIEKQTLKGHTGPIQVVTFSPDSQTLASASGDQTVRLWETATGFESIDKRIANIVTESLSFSNNGENLKIDQGILSLDSDLSDLLNHQDQQSCVIFVNKEWVIQDGQKILWLPPDYRATCTAVYENKLVLGHQSGQVTFLEFSHYFLNSR